MKFLHKTQLLFIHFRNNERVHPRKHATDAIRWISSDNPAKIFHYKITKIVRELWLAERSVCMRVCKHGCDLKMFCFSKANHASANLKKFLSSKLDKFTLFTHSFVGWKLENLYKQAVSILFLREKQNIFWLTSIYPDSYLVYIVG